MGKPKYEINVERCKRFKQILDQTNTTQTYLSKKIGLSKQSIGAMVNCRADVTERTAKLVTDLFPQYKFSWLMYGYADLEDNLRMQRALEELDNFKRKYASLRGLLADVIIAIDNLN